jgi:heat shock protein HslJ
LKYELEIPVRKKFYLFCLLVLLLSACAAKSSGAAALQGTWTLVSYGSLEELTPAVADSNAALAFGDDGTVSGSGGCNSLGGEYEVTGNEITFGEITSTLMACEEPRMAQESFVTQVLSGTAQFEATDETLTITNNDKVLVFSKVEGR